MIFYTIHYFLSAKFHVNRVIVDDAIEIEAILHDLGEIYEKKENLFVGIRLLLK